MLSKSSPTRSDAYFCAFTAMANNSGCRAIPISPAEAKASANTFGNNRCNAGSMSRPRLPNPIHAELSSKRVMQKVGGRFGRSLRNVRQIACVDNMTGQRGIDVGGQPSRPFQAERIAMYFVGYDHGNASEYQQVAAPGMGVLALETAYSTGAQGDHCALASEYVLLRLETDRQKSAKNGSGLPFQLVPGDVEILVSVTLTGMQRGHGRKVQPAAVERDVRKREVMQEQP